MDIRMKWFYRLGFLLLLFIVLFIFMKLKPMWAPIIAVCVKVLIPFLIAAFISYLLHPVVEILHKKGMKRGLSIAIIYLVFFGGFGFAVYKGIPIMTEQLRELTENAPQAAERYREWTDWIGRKTENWPFGIHERLDATILKIEAKLESTMDAMMSYMMKLFDFFLVIALIPFIAFYIVKDYDALKKMTRYLTPRKWRSQGIAFLKDIDLSLGGYIRGQIIVCAAIGGISSLLFWLFGMSYPLLLGALIGITNIIPYFGPIFGAIPAALIAATISVKMIIIVVIIVLVLQFLEGNILSPLIIGKSLHMHPIFIMFALLVGGEVGGVIGLIMAVPILAILKVIVIHSRSHFKKVQSTD